MSVQQHVLLFEGERTAGRNAHLFGHQVHARDHFRDGVFHLQAGVHFHKEELVRGGIGDQELHGAGTGVVHGPGGVAGCLTDPFPGGGIQQHRGCFLDHLLVPALQGTFPLPQVDHVSVGIRENLHLDVPGRGHQPFQEQGVVPERGGSHPPGCLQGRRQVFAPLHGLHAFAAAPGGGFDQEGIPDVVGSRHQPLIVESGLRDAGHHGHPVALHVVLGADLVPHQVQGGYPGADERDAGVGKGPGEFDILAEEPVSRVHGLRSGAPAGRQYGLHGEVALPGRCRAQPYRSVGLPDVAGPGVVVAVDRHGPDAQAAQRADDPAGDLPAVGHQDGVEKRGGCWCVVRLHGAHIRNRPKEVSGRGALAQTSRARPRTVRVSRGSMMPSSHSRAVE